MMNFLSKACAAFLCLLFLCGSARLDRVHAQQQKTISTNDASLDIAKIIRALTGRMNFDERSPEALIQCAHQ